MALLIRTLVSHLQVRGDTLGIVSHESIASTPLYCTASGPPSAIRFFLDSITQKLRLPRFGFLLIHFDTPVHEILTCPHILLQKAV